LYPKTDNVPVRATFRYHSYSSPDKVISFDYMVRENVEIESRERNYENSENLDPGLDPDVLSLDSDEALKIMYEQLGDEFFRDCQVGSWPLIMNLEYGFPNVSEDEVWSLTFACDKPEKGAAIIISANTGEVLEIRR
ncbi:MAG TPA: hypothetical protein DCX53_12140, partial [Anaerolineae bacterium]|nr:hypothetical protein [Anaerolineae bacterium]